MDAINDNKKDEILYHAERTLFYTNLLIKQCDSWLSAEEGNRNMMKAFEERRKKEKKTKMTKISKMTGMTKILNRFFGMKPTTSPPAPSPKERGNDAQIMRSANSPLQWRGDGGEVKPSNFL
jgi:hypothetical protein